jgi:hypothetical protein
MMVIGDLGLCDFVQTITPSSTAGYVSYEVQKAASIDVAEGVHAWCRRRRRLHSVASGLPPTEAALLWEQICISELC